MIKYKGFNRSFYKRFSINCQYFKVNSLYSGGKLVSYHAKNISEMAKLLPDLFR